ncbi:imidazolonepropionase-like domain-containing protein [Streptomyces lutosisoli]|uniref:Aminodeoxyfutalosine deaminase/Imidazolonepropionase-like composite domain-containing protein n=1 Tax=Streptomyces lutosisoli TaxID=2665721 RepID=A0ABW2VGC9_9ACTN
MLTIHAADELRFGWDDSAPVKGGAVVVEGMRVAASGPLSELQERFPGARVRRWPGVLGPARIHEGPLPDAPTPRERIHAVLKLGAVAVLAEHADSPELRAAAERNDVLVLPRTRPTVITDLARADLAVFDEDGNCIATVCAGRLVHRRR